MRKPSIRIESERVQVPIRPMFHVKQDEHGWYIGIEDGRRVSSYYPTKEQAEIAFKVGPHS